MFVYEVVRDDGQRVSYLSILDPATVKRGNGLRSEAILGHLSGGPDQPDRADQIGAEHVVPNPVFVHFLNWTIARHCTTCPGLLAEVARQRDGFVYISDGRTRNADGSVAGHDVIGAVEIEDGKIVRYRGNPDYRAYTAAGPPRLDPWLHARWMEELAALP